MRTLVNASRLSIAALAGCVAGLGIAAPAVAAQEVSVRAAVDRQRVPVNGRIALSLRVDGTQQAAAPDIDPDGFVVRYVGPSTQVSLVNGQMSASVVHTYVLMPQREGTLTIDPITVQVDGRSFNTEPITVEVLPASSAQQASPGSSGVTGEPTAPLGDALQFQLGVDRTRAYLGQAIPARLQLLIGGVAVRGIEMPVLEADGFLVTPVQQPEQSDVVVNGQPHALLEFRTTLVPIRTGALTAGPATIGCQVAVRRERLRQPSASGGDPFEQIFGGSLFDDFFGHSRVQSVQVTADPVTIAVLPLPEEGQPPGFTGAVGRLTLKADAVPIELAAGEPVTLTVTVTGEGNFDTVSAPELVGDLSGFKVYPPQQRQATGGATEPGAKVFEQVLIPLDPAVREIPPARFSYFDPVSGRYETITEPAIPLVVHPPTTEERPAIVEPAPAPTASAKPETLGRDLVYIKDDLGPLYPVGRSGAVSWAWLWWACAAPLACLALSEWLRRRRARAAADPGAVRASGAMRRAMARCQAARALQQSGKVTECYAEIQRAVQRYIGDRLNLPSDGLTKSEMERHLLARGASQELVREFGELIERCDAARFAPASVAADQADTALRATEALLRRLERWPAQAVVGRGLRHAAGSANDKTERP
jgi:hypothetical protein